MAMMLTLMSIMFMMLIMMLPIRRGMARKEKSPDNCQ